MAEMKTSPSTSLRTGVLYYGDNLDVLRKHIPDESIDLIYLDPPFNSSCAYNVLFRESTGAASEAQIEAFEIAGGGKWIWKGVKRKQQNAVQDSILNRGMKRKSYGKISSS